MKDEQVKELKELYPKGTKIMLEHMDGESQMRSGLTGTVNYVDDAGQIHMNWENGSSLALVPDVDKFTVLNTIKVIYVEPGKPASLVEITDDLASLQKLVGGYIEEYMPFEDEVAIVCNDEGKLNGLPLNRGIYSEENELMDIIAGPFIICYARADSERYENLPKELEKKYLEKFKDPHKFYKTISGIQVIPFSDSEKSYDRER